MTYDPSIEIAYTPVDTDADEARKWENLRPIWLILAFESLSLTQL